MDTKHTSARCLIGLLLLFAASSSCGQPAPTPEPATIRFAFQEDDEPHYEALVEVFQQEYPYITVELVPKTWQELYEYDLDGVDAFHNRLYSTVGEMARQGAILTLEPYLDADRSFDPEDFYPGTLDLCRSEGQLWAIPAGGEPTVVVYNKDLFDRYEVAYPEVGWTWDDLVTIASTLRSEEEGIWGVAFAPGGVGPSHYVWQHGGRFIDDRRNPTRTTFDDPLTIEALE